MLKPLERELKKNFLWFLIALALINGLLYVFLVPPWQHYDEPGHFEYAWLVAHRPQWPQEGDFDLKMRQEVAKSMVEHNFYHGMNNVPDLTLNTQDPINIGISQTQKEPLYYFLASIPIRVFQNTDITTQLYMTRLISLFLFLLTIFFSYRASCELFQADHPLRWMIPIFICLLPPFVDLMTAVNNDVIATACGTLFFWLCIVVIQKGVSLPRMIWLIVACALCILSKDNSAMISIPLGALALILGYFRANPKLAWGIAAASVILVFGLAFSWDSVIPAYFYSYGETFLPQRQESSRAPVGKYVLAQKSQEADWNSFYFMIPPDDYTRLRGKVATLGFWAWATQPVDISAPMLQVYKSEVNYNGLLHLESEPRFFKLPIILPEQANLGWFWIFTTEKIGITLYWNGFVLTEGDFSKAPPPIFLDDRALEGTWGGKHFTNIIQGSSARSVWPILRPELGNTIQKLGLTSSYLWSWLDWRSTGWYFRGSAAQIFRTFWGKFSWAQVNLTGQKPFRLFIFITLLSAFGLIPWSLKHFKEINLNVMLFLGISSFLVLSIVLMRGVGSWLNQIFLPGARYTYPAIFTMTFYLCLGWYGLTDLLPIKSGSRTILGLVFLLLLILYNGWAIYSIQNFYLGV